MININFLKQYDYFKEEELLELVLLKNQGFNNKNLLLKTLKENFLIRVFKIDKNLDRKFEFEIAQKAYKKHIGAKPLVLDIKNSLMVFKFIEGFHKTSLSKIDIKNLAQLIKELHNIKTYKKPLNLQKTHNSYSKKSLSNNFFKIKKAYKSLKKYKKEYVLCHHDLNPKNILFSNEIKLIDWEYARINDKYFDLASIIVEFDLNRQNEVFFTRSYFKNTQKLNYEKLCLYKVIYKDLCRLWFDK